jgi:hypothetical protein
MLGAEANFDEDNPADYSLFGIRYLLLPTGMKPPVTAAPLIHNGAYALWQLPGNTYVEIVQVTGRISADRADVGAQSLSLLESLLPGEDSDVQWPGAGPAPEPRARQYSTTAPATLESLGRIASVSPLLGQGELSAEVTMTKAGTLLVAISYDPGWHAWVDGRRAPTEMLAPALVGIPLPAGHYHVVLRYVGFGWYPELWVLGLLALGALAEVGRRQHQVRPGGTQGVLVYPPAPGQRRRPRRLVRWCFSCR